MTRALVTGAGGFIAGHLVERLKADGYWVRGVDIKRPEFRESAADEFACFDLRDTRETQHAFTAGEFDEVYHLAADMGGMGHLAAKEWAIMRNNALIDLNVVTAAARHKVKRFFYASSACVYQDVADMVEYMHRPAFPEESVYPAMPDNEYGWEKLFAERVLLTACRESGMQPRIARFQNCYGPFGTYAGGREKAPAALCRKAALAEAGGTIDVWGDGAAVRNFIYVDDLVDGIRVLVESDHEQPVNIGTEELVTVNQLADTVIAASGKDLAIRHVDGPVGVAGRNHSIARIKSLGWEPCVSLREGIENTYAWIVRQVETREMQTISK